MRHTLVVSLALVTLGGLFACSSSSSSNDGAVTTPDGGTPVDEGGAGVDGGGDGALKDWELAIPSATVSALARSEAGDLFIAGDVLPGKTNFGAGEVTVTEDARLYVAKLSTAGKLAWAKMFKYTTTETGLLSLAPDANGGVHVLVGATGSVDFGGGAKNVSSTSGKPSFAWGHLDTAGAHVKSEVAFMCRQGCSRSFIARKGATLWFQTASADNIDIGPTVFTGNGTSQAIAFSTDESLAPGFSSSVNGDFARGVTFDPQGHPVFAGAGGSSGFSTGVDVYGGTMFISSGAVDDFEADTVASRAPIAGAIAGVYAAGTSSKGRGFVAIDIPATPKLSQIGWATEAKMGTPDDFLEFGAASSDANDNVVFVGSFAGKLTVDAAVLTSSNGSTKDKSDIFVVRLSPDGKSTGSKRLGGATEDRGRHVVALPGGRAIVGGVVGGSGYVAAITF